MLAFGKKTKNTREGSRSSSAKRSDKASSGLGRKVNIGSVGSSIGVRQRSVPKKSTFYASQKKSSNTPKQSDKKSPRQQRRSFSMPQMFRVKDWGLLRIKSVVVLFGILWLVLWGRVWQVQMLDGSRLADQASKQHLRSVLVTGKRGSITDRNGQVLARSVESLSVYVRPHEIKDAKATATVLAELLQQPVAKLEAQLSKKSRKFIWLARKVDDHTAMRVQKARLTGIGLSKEYHRVYPFRQMAGHVLGFVGVDDQGLEGVERAFEDELASVPARRTVQRDALGRRFYMHAEGQSEPQGQDIRLTLDSQMQFFAEEAITKAVEKYEASWGGVLVVDVESGDIVAWAQYPFFNPNSFNTYKPSQYRNRLATDAIEPGSTIKPFLVAAAIQEGLVNRNTIFDCEGGRWQTKTITIRDTSVHDKLSVTDILRYSSNIGVAKIGQKLGAKSYHNYLEKLGFGKRTVVPVAEHKGIMRNHKNWAEADLLTTSFGQSISVTGLQMAQAYLTLINDGVVKPLRLVLDDGADTLKKQAKPVRVYRTDVARTVTRMLQGVVEEDGSGKRARIPGTIVAGKTGTAQKHDKKTGTYGKGRMASFVGFAPADKPRYLTLVMVDEPTKNQYGGVVAAPVFQEVTRMALMYDGKLPDVVFAENMPKIKRGASFDAKARGFKMSRSPQPLFAMKSMKKIQRSTPYNTLPGQHSEASSLVPNVIGKTVRNAVELFARGGIVPVLKGQGQRVIHQSPKAGSAWPKEEDGKKIEYVLQLSEL